MDARPRPIPVASLALLVALRMPLSGGPWPLLSDLAVLTAIVAAAERRTAASLVAAGLAAGLAIHGLLVLPLVVAATVRASGRPGEWALLPLAALGAAMLPADRGAIAASIGLWSIGGPAVRGLCIASAAGIGGWLAAARTTPGRRDDLTDGSAMFLALAWPLLLPATAGDLALPLALAFAVRRGARRRPAANDNAPRHVVPPRRAYAPARVAGPARPAPPLSDRR